MKVVILAGGLGSRLSEETVTKPKPMVEIGVDPILWHIMKTYGHHGFNEFVIALGYKGQVIKDYFVNAIVRQSDLAVDLASGKVHYLSGNKEPWKVELIDTGPDTLTGGRVKRLDHVLRPYGTFMLTYGDGVANVDITALLQFHRSHGKIGTITAVRPPARFGALDIQSGGKVMEFKEKPQIGEGWINGGYFVFEPQFLDYIKGGDGTILEREPLEQLARDGQLMAFEHSGFWHPMDTIRDRDFLNDVWKKREAPWKVWKD